MHMHGIFQAMRLTVPVPGPRTAAPAGSNQSMEDAEDVTFHEEAI